MGYASVAYKTFTYYVIRNGWEFLIFSSAQRGFLYASTESCEAKAVNERKKPSDNMTQSEL